MIRKSRPLWAGLSYLALAALSPLDAGSPNVVLFIVDDLGWTDVGCYGSDLYQTPHVDRLASQGVRFTNAYAACTVCSPTRAAIMSGKYPARLNCTDWISGHQRPFAKLAVPDWTPYLAESEYTLAEALRDAGYATAHIGKWHLGESENFWPENQGFEINIAGNSGGSPVANGGKGYFSPYNIPRLEDGPKGEYLTERLAEEACAFIERASRDEKPFFLNLWLYSVHTPIQAREELIGKYQRLAREDARHTNPVYAAMVEHMDTALGKVLAQLKDSGIERDTVVIFSSDNGGLCGNRRWKVTSNAPLRSGKGDIYEGGVRVPFVVSWPAAIPGARVIDTPVISMDIYPTVLELTDVAGRQIQNQELDGLSLKPVLSGQATIDRDSLFWHYPHYHTQGAQPYSAIRKGHWKLIHVYEEPEVQLYNLQDDLSEARNLADARPEIRDQLMEELNSWRQAVAAQAPTPNPHYDPEKADQPGR